ncbi:hypothetical protein BDR07DRAFT_1385393 [Suillus spraguei]|nr:hypothetical protein BDR07DRAFT_1385393 [Suillus spraguei]
MVEELNAKYHEINMHLSDLQYGPFKIAVTFFGLDKAIELGRTSQTYTIKPAMQSIATHKRLKEAAKEKEDEEDDNEIEIIKHVKGKRARLEFYYIVPYTIEWEIHNINGVYLTM